MEGKDQIIIKQIPIKQLLYVLTHMLVAQDYDTIDLLIKRDGQEVHSLSIMGSKQEEIEKLKDNNNISENKPKPLSFEDLEGRI